MDVDYIKDISSPRETKEHKVRLNGDLFVCAPRMPAGVIQDITKMRATFSKLQADLAAGRPVNEDQVSAMNLKLFEILDIVLVPTSAELFAQRMRDPDNPIDMVDIGNFINWMMEEYGERPTTPSSSSPPSPSSTGTNSTDGLLPTREPLPDYSTSPI